MTLGGHLKQGKKIIMSTLNLEGSAEGIWGYFCAFGLPRKAYVFVHVESNDILERYLASFMELY